MTQLEMEDQMESAPPEPCAPTLSYEAACALLRGQGRLISPDDIELVVLVALQNEFLRLQFESSRELMERHNEALTKIMGTAVKSMRDSIAEERTAFSSAVRAVALENVTALISQHQKDMAEHALAVKLGARMVLAAALVLGLALIGAGFLMGGAS